MRPSPRCHPPWASRPVLLGKDLRATRPREGLSGEHGWPAASPPGAPELPARKPVRPRAQLSVPAASRRSSQPMASEAERQPRLLPWGTHLLEANTPQQQKKQHPQSPTKPPQSSVGAHSRRPSPQRRCELEGRASPHWEPPGGAVGPGALPSALAVGPGASSGRARGPSPTPNAKPREGPAKPPGGVPTPGVLERSERLLLPIEFWATGKTRCRLGRIVNRVSARTDRTGAFTRKKASLQEHTAPVKSQTGAASA